MIQPQRSPSGALSLSISMYRPPLRRAASCCGVELDRAAQRASRVWRNGEVSDDRPAHAGQRTHVQMRASRNGEQPAERTLQGERVALERRRDRPAARTIGACPDQAWSRRKTDVECGGGRAAAPGSTLRKHAPSRNALATFSAVLRARTGLRKIAVGIFKHFILIPVAQLTMKIGVPVGGGLAGFFFHRALVEIAVRVLLFWHRALRDEGFACGVVRKKPGGRIISGPKPILAIGPRSRPLFLCSYGALPRPSRVPSRIAYIRRRAGRRRRRYGN